MNFSKLTNIKKFSKETISITDLVELVKNNPQEDLIKRIRKVEYKSKEYNNLKTKVSCITPHAILKGLKNEDFISNSGYLYFDIDGFNNDIDRIKTSKSLIKDFPISFLCKSVGGKGISFMVKIDFDINKDNFSYVYGYVRNLFIKKGYDIDLSASGLVRKMIISMDKDIYFNNKVSLPINKVSYKEYKNDLNQSKKIESRRERGITGNDTFLESSITLINKGDLKIIEETQIDTKKYKIEEVEYYRIYVPKKIKDGDKHKVYTRIMNALFYLNEGITISEVYSYLYYINEKAENKFNNYYLKRFVYNLCNGIMKNGVRIKLGKKKIHLSDKYKNKKEDMGGKINAKIRQNESIRKIEEARLYCASENIKPTQKNIQKITGLGIATVKRNWKKTITDIDSYINQIDKEIDLETTNELNDEIVSERNNKLIELTGDSLEEDEFWNNWEPRKIYKEKEFFDKDFGESDGIDGFITNID